MRVEIQENNFDSFLFIRITTTHRNSDVSEFCNYTTENFIHGLIANIVYNNDYTDLTGILTDDVNKAIWQIITETFDDIYSDPTSYDPPVVDFYFDYRAELASVLYMTLLQGIDGIVRFIPEILGAAAKMNITYNDFRFTADTNRYILRMIRKPKYVY